MAVREKIAPAATGLARSNKPGRMLANVESQTARSGVSVLLLFLPKKPPSGRPEVGEKPHAGDATDGITVIAAEGVKRTRGSLERRLHDEESC